MAVFRHSIAMRNAAARLFQQHLDASDKSIPGQVFVRSGTMPASPDDEPFDGDLLAVLTCQLPSAEEAVDGVLTLLPIQAEQFARASGRATWARAVDGDGRPIADVDITDTNGDGTIRLKRVDVIAGEKVWLNSFVVTQPMETDHADR